jgi:hypothetical protein
MGEDGEIVLDGFPKMLKLRIMVIMVWGKYFWDGGKEWRSLIDGLLFRWLFVGFGEVDVKEFFYIFGIL